MRIVLADLKSTEGFVSKDTVAGGYGSRLRPFSRVTSIVAGSSAGFTICPSVQLAYLAALAASRRTRSRSHRAAKWSTATSRIVLSSLVDFRHEAAWARVDARARHAGRLRRTGGVEAAATVRELDADFIVNGEPEAAQ